MTKTNLTSWFILGSMGIEVHFGEIVQLWHKDKFYEYKEALENKGIDVLALQTY